MWRSRPPARPVCRCESSAAGLKRRACGAWPADAPSSFSAGGPTEEIRQLYQTGAMVLLPGVEDFGIVPVEAQACGTPVVALGRRGCLRDRHRWRDRRAGRRRRRRVCRRHQARARRSADAGGHPRERRDGFPGSRFERTRFAAAVQSPDSSGGRLMMRRYNRLLVAFYVASDAGIAAASFVLAYWVRFAGIAGAERHSAVRRIPGRPALSCAARSDRVPHPGDLSAAARPLPGGRLLRRVRRHRPRGRAGRGRHAVLPHLLAVG